MNIPNLPTDNMYKFIALAGLSLCVLSPVYYQVFSREVILKNFELRAEMRRIKQESQFLREDVDELRGESNELKGAPNVADEKGRILKQAAALEEKTRELMRQQIQADKLASEALLSNDQIDQLWWVSLVGLIAGINLLSFGLRLWYTRVQKYQDQVLAGDASKVNLATSKKDAPAGAVEDSPVDVPSPS